MRCLVLSFLTLFCGVGLAQTRAEEPIKTTLCGLIQNPDQFNGKMVTVRGQIEIDFEDFGLATRECHERKADGIWLEYGRGPKNQPTVWCCGDLTPVDPLRLVQNGEFKRFHRFITARLTDCDGYGCNRYAVTATLTGRLDSVATVLCPDGKSRCPEKGGFGHFGGSSVRLMIRSVANVTANPVDRSKH